MPSDSESRHSKGGERDKNRSRRSRSRDRDRERERERDRSDRKRYRSRSRSRSRERNRDYRDRDRDRNRDRERERDRDREREREREKDKERDRNRERERNKEEERDKKRDAEAIDRKETSKESKSETEYRNKKQKIENSGNTKQENSDSKDNKTKDGEGEEKKKIEKEKPNFNLTGKLAAEANTYNGVVLKYSEPPEARKTTVKWRFHIFKGDKQLEPLPVYHQSGYLLGRDRLVADIPIDHPSCSKQHAVLQYRQVQGTDKNGDPAMVVKPYLIDLNSSNGSFINGEKLEPSRYYELKQGDVIKFGFSTRDYIFIDEDSV